MASRGGFLPERASPKKAGGPKSAILSGGRRVAGPGRAGSGRAGTIPLFVHALNNERFAPKGIEDWVRQVHGSYIRILMYSLAQRFSQQLLLRLSVSQLRLRKAKGG